MASNRSQSGAKSRTEQRAAARRTLVVPFRLTTPGRLSQAVDGETMDVSSTGLGVKFESAAAAKLDGVLESLVEDRLGVEVTLRLPQGSVSTEGQVMWWGLLGDDAKFAIRAGILLKQPWSKSDWQLIESCAKA